MKRIKGVKCSGCLKVKGPLSMRVVIVGGTKVSMCASCCRDYIVA